MNDEILQLAKELKSDALLNQGFHHQKSTVSTDKLINLCGQVEVIIRDNVDSSRLISAFCNDDKEWHTLLDKEQSNNSTLISIILKLTDKCSELNNELSEIKNSQPVGYLYTSPILKSLTFTSDINEIKEIIKSLGVKNKLINYKAVYFLDKQPCK